MELVKEVVVGREMMSSSKIKSEPVNIPLPTYHHDSLQCFQCFITFCDPKAKERHMKKSHRELYKLQLQQTNTVFTCYKCDKNFSNSDELSQHQASHSNEEKSFHCTYCVERFFTFSELTKHRRYECIERRCPCRDCGVFFPSPSRLRHHRITVHFQFPEGADSFNTYQCGKCNCCFQTEEELLQHQERYARDHKCAIKWTEKKRGRKPKKVAQGGTNDSKMIKQEVKLEESDRNKDSPTKQQQGKLMIPCPEEGCDLVFASVAALRAHKKDQHSSAPFPRKAKPCTECDESYARLDQLNAHIARVHGSNRYNCSTCGKSFGRESNLKAHQKMHMEGEEGVGKL
ncbi:zinc finger protein 497-like isoform X2 [Thalassophryne amazonica]|uniref:zinc finger protein 497-like isoform X2 n=1 Tax=Thalassophryne amazonica TaxID=390379 RepID=UPI00147221CA|nr:zinc finger protein 497-like isoform X2 [Thalassophryne amazonica]XP_034016571.1 zinc finger protein 497-like isoform X2 [Thalassophryne amazonica]